MDVSAADAMEKRGAEIHPSLEGAGWVSLAWYKLLEGECIKWNSMTSGKLRGAGRGCSVGEGSAGEVCCPFPHPVYCAAMGIFFSLDCF